MKYPEICNRFREVRVNSRLTQAEFAKMVGMSPGGIAAIEAGLYTPNFGVMRRLRQKLGVSYNWLIDGDKEVSGARINELQEENQRLKRIVDKLTS